MQKVLRFGHSPSLLLLLPLFWLKNNCRHVAKRPSSLTDRQRDSKRDRGKREVGRPATPDWQRSSIRDLRLSTWVAWAKENPKLSMRFPLRRTCKNIVTKTKTEWRISQSSNNNNNRHTKRCMISTYLQLQECLHDFPPQHPFRSVQ